MGGLGSGNWWREDPPKTTVEECQVLSIKELPKPLCVGLSGELHLKRRNRRVFKLNYTIIGTVEHRAVRLYSDSPRQVPVDVTIPLTTTATTFGGQRFWFSCPHSVGITPCEKRATKLYSLPGIISFGCRKCHDLVYRSSQEAHRTQRMLSRMGIDPRQASAWERNERWLRDFLIEDLEAE